MRQQGKNVMHSVKIDKVKLLAIVKENKAKHISEYNEAVDDYKALAVKIAKHNLELANTGDLDKIKDMKSVPTAPTSYEADYTRAARMLELSVDDVIELEDVVFNQLVLDEWAWKRSFTTSSMLYKSSF
jgi:fibronectin type 3 domain-containing protein